MPLARMQSNAAYDFELFEDKPEKSRPVLNVVANTKYKKRDRMTVVRVISSAVVIVAVICMMLLSYVRLTELANEITTNKKAYQLLVSENTRLKAEMESKVSLRGVEESAQQLGMVKMQSYQVEYIDMQTDEEVNLSGGAAEMPVTEKLSLYIQSFLEYISVK